MKLVSAENLIDELLAEQQSLTAVERFSQFHENETTPLLEKRYRNLIPFSRPGEGEQYSFEVDLDACSGCKACVTACHSLNGLDEGESWRDVGALVSLDEDSSSQQTVTTACHHCADPACANGCPTLAYEKDSETGIVRHLDDQCIGCQYCTMTCPYDVPKYNDALGIVRKCDMCQSRLRDGEAPACVQACPNEAIKIRIVPVEEVKSRPVNGSSILPGTAPSRITKPSTTFLNLYNPGKGRIVPADHDSLKPAHAHFPLVAMLVMTQAASGVLLFDAIAGPGRWHTVMGAFLAVAGLAAATLHLGRPLQAWRSFLGWRKSWLSREILVFGPWAGLALIAAVTPFLPVPPVFGDFAIWGAATLGIIGVFCSVMVYAFTQRPFWNLTQTGTRFGLTLLAAGSLFTFPVLSVVAMLGKMAAEWYVSRPDTSPFPFSARLIRGALQSFWKARLVTGAVALLLAATSLVIPVVAFPAFGFVLLSEFLSRVIYFQAVEEPHMPGGAAS
ncbi:MAG: dimethyl sulfoxide reductase anchor subunit [Verrucomicrobiales bacterium]|nr:dimethyl sulfoxide reductase anchor subunit [Verrucomicrobiales bacterium]